MEGWPHQCGIVKREYRAIHISTNITLPFVWSSQDLETRNPGIVILHEMCLIIGLHGERPCPFGCPAGVDFKGVLHAVPQVESTFTGRISVLESYFEPVLKIIGDAVEMINGCLLYTSDAATILRV